MKYRKLGRTGLEVSEIGFGAWAVGGNWGEQKEDESIAALHKAIDNGVNSIDTAQGYGEGRSERIIAKVLKERSEDIYVATKTPPAPGPWPPSPYCKWEDRFSRLYRFLCKWQNAYLINGFSRLSNIMENCEKIKAQSLIGIVHFLAISL